jgi:hypothetical protein
VRVLLRGSASGEAIEPRTVRRGDPRSPAPLEQDFTSVSPKVYSFRRRSLQRSTQLLLRGGVQQSRAIRVGAAAVAHAAWIRCVVPLGQLADPIRQIVGTRRALPGTQATREEPQNLPRAALIRLLGRAVASLQRVDAHVRSKMNPSCHASILQGPSKTWYQTQRAHRGFDHTGGDAMRVEGRVLDGAGADLRAYGRQAPQLVVDSTSDALPGSSQRHRGSGGS